MHLEQLVATMISYPPLLERFYMTGLKFYSSILSVYWYNKSSVLV